MSGSTRKNILRRIVSQPLRMTARRTPTPYTQKRRSKSRSQKSVDRTVQNSNLAHYFQNVAGFYKTLGKKQRRTNLILNHPDKKLKSMNTQLIKSSTFLNMIAFDPSVFGIYLNEYNVESFSKDYMVPLTNGQFRSEKSPMEFIQKIRSDKGKSAIDGVKSFLPSENTIDIHIYIMMCALVYHNKPMKQFLSVCLNESEPDIDNAVQYTLSPYMESRVRTLRFRGGKNTVIGKMIKLLFIIFNALFLSFLIYYTNQATHQMIDLIYTGKTANAFLNIKDAVEMLDVTETCRTEKTGSPKAYELLEWILPKESVDTYGKFVNVYQCVSTQEKSVSLIGELVMMYNPMDKKSDQGEFVEPEYAEPEYDDVDEEEREEDEGEYKGQEEPDTLIRSPLLLNAPVIQKMLTPKNELTKSSPIPELFALTLYEAQTIPGFDTINEKSLMILNSNILKIQEKAMQYFLPERGHKKTKETNFKAGLKYLDDLSSENDDILANQILDDELLVLYNKHKYVSTGTGTATPYDNKVVTVKPTDYLSQITNTVVYKQASLIATLAGSVIYDMIVTPSHTPVFDLIAAIRAKINVFSRSMRDSYNKNEDLLNDVMSELALIQAKAQVAWSRAKWIAGFGTFFIGLVLEYIYDVVPIPRLENGNGNQQGNDIPRLQSTRTGEQMLLEDDEKKKKTRIVRQSSIDSVTDMFANLGPLR
jgi:hypothetical protein